MPALTFVASSEDDMQQLHDRILETLDSALHTRAYTHEVLRSGPSHYLAATRYPEYPLYSVETDRLWVCLEGQIYGQYPGGIERQLLQAAELLCDSSATAQVQLAHWLQTIDGEFVLFALNKCSGTVALVNDFWGHLPVYYHHAGRRCVISRELAVVIPLMRDIIFDRQALAELLLFRYTLGSRTLVQNVMRLPPGTMVRLKPGDDRIDVCPLRAFSFAIRANAHKSVSENSSELAELLLSACNDRVSPARGGGGGKCVPWL